MPVTLVVVPLPQIAVSQASLSFGSIVTGSKSTLQEVVSNTGGGQLTWSVATGGAAWLSVDTSSGSVFSGNPETIHITVDATSLAAGSYTATLNFSSNGGSQPVTVTLVVTA